MPSLRLLEEHGAAEADLAVVMGGLRGFNRRHMPPGEPQPLNLLLRGEADEIRGGLLAATRWDWLLIHMLWIQDEDRGAGHGRALLERAEAIALGRGCRRAVLDTTDFQARGFYEKAGYRVFGELADYPPGSRTFHLEKTLNAPGMDR